MIVALVERFHEKYNDSQFLDVPQILGTEGAPDCGQRGEAAGAFAEMAAASDALF